MGIFKIKSPDGRIVTLRGDTPPTEADLDQIFASIPSKATSKSLIPRIPLAGPFGRGVEAAERGASFKDLPHVAAKTLSGALGSAPEDILKKPIAGLFQRSSSEPNLSFLFPKASTFEGEKLGRDLENIGGLLDVGLVGKQAINQAGKIIIPTVKKAIEVGKKEIPEGYKLAKRETLRGIFADRGKVIQGLKNVTRRTTGKELSSLRSRVAGELDTLKGQIKNEVDSLTQQLNSEVREGALQAQKALPRYFGKRSTEYGESLENIISQNNPQISRLDISRALESTLEEAGLRGFSPRQPSGPVEKAIFDLATEYADISRAKELVPANNAVAIKKMIQGTLSSGKKLGSQPYGSDEHILSSFMENYGQLLEDKIEGLRDLNQAYRPFIQLKRQAIRTFRPFSGEFATKSGESVIKRVSLPRGRGTGEEAMINFLEKETGVPFSGKSRQVGESLSLAKTSGAARAKAIAESGSERAKSLSEAMQQRLIELEAKKKKVERGVGGKVIGAARRLYRLGSGRLL